jgi:hypothetical protein
MSDSAAITGIPFDNVAAYEDAEWHTIWGTLFDGLEERGPLLGHADEFVVTESSPAAMTIEVAAGTAFIGGLWGQSEDAETLTVAANGGGANRYDLVFLHWQRANQYVELRIVDGTAATCAAAIAPAPNAIATYQTAGPPVTQWAVPIACITVTPGATEILNANITDLREFSRFRTAAGDIVDGTSIDTAIIAGITPAMTDTGAILEIAAAGVGVDEISSAIAGDALTGGDGSALDVVPGTGLEISVDTLQIAATAAGDGLSGGAGAALDVNVDAATIVIVADTLSVGAVDKTHLDDRIRRIWVGANEMHIDAAGGAAWGALGGQPVAAEGWVFSPTVNESVIAHIVTDQDFYLSSPSAGYVEFVWSHALGAGGPFTVYWRWRNIGWYGGGKDCGDNLTGGVETGHATATNEVSVATQHYRKCTQSTDQLVGFTSYANGYLDLQIGRHGADPIDTYVTGDVVLLGIWINYLADM